MQIPLPQTTFAIAVPLAIGATFSPVGNAWGQQEAPQIPQETAQQLLWEAKGSTSLHWSYWFRTSSVRPCSPSRAVAMNMTAAAGAG